MRRLFQTFSIQYCDFLLIILIVLLNLIGIMAIGSAAPALQMRQVYGMITGLVMMMLVSALDYQRVIRYHWLWYALSIVLLLMVMLFGQSGGGAQRWVSIGGVTFQPSEAVKILLILFYAKFIMRYKNRMGSIGFIVICLLIAVPPLVLVYEQPDLSTTITLFLIIAAMLFVGGMSYKLAAGVLIVAIPSAIIFINLVIQEGSTILNQYQRNRILAWLHPEDYETTISYQTVYSIMAIGSGQLMGKGYNTNEISSLLNSGYISASQTDFIFTVVGEEFGFIGGCAVILLLALISVRLFWTARECRDMAGTMIATGMGAWIGFQGFMNIGVATGILPNTGLPLPFVSYGLTSLVSLYIGVGFSLNVRMQEKKARRRTGLRGMNEPRTAGGV